MFEVLDSELLIQAPIIALRRDTLTMPGGSIATREIVEHYGAVAVVAVNDKGEVALVSQYRHSVGTHLLEIPAGLMDIAGEDPHKAAMRELQEEAGLKASSWTLLADHISSPGFCDEVVRIYLATDLEEVGRTIIHDDEEAEMTLQWVPLSDCVRQVLSGGISNGIAMSALLMANEVINHGAEARPVDTPFPLRPTAFMNRKTNAGTN
ncbi:MAG: NUDIX hydrolase [Corynebacterium sp.]|nr:NUDIX hydrolase [Corynebacterium sp.]